MTKSEQDVDKFELMRMQVRNRIPLGLSDSEAALTAIIALRVALEALQIEMEQVAGGRFGTPDRELIGNWAKALKRLRESA